MTPDHDAIAAAAAQHRLRIFGAFHPREGDGAPQSTGTLVLLGPDGPGFWSHLTAQPEWDGTDPVDRWSTRAIGELARDLGARALFPFGGPPWHPFVGWALRSGRAWTSPVGLLVHDAAGLMVSYRGALALPGRIALPAPPATSPCTGCPAPCRTACPPAALGAGGFHLPACRAHLSAPRGRECRTGCLVRRACPVSRAHHRDPRQSAYHMHAFQPGPGPCD